MRIQLRGNRKQSARIGARHRYCQVGAAMVGAAVVGGVASNSAASKGAKASAAAQDKALAANAYQGEIATDQYETYKSTYLPLEKQMVADATSYDSQANQDKAAASAQANVNSQIAGAKEALQRTPGMDPSSAAAQAANTTLGLKGAALGAAEQNKARENVTNMAYARKQDAVALGKGLVSNAASGLASATAGANAIAAQSAAQANSAASGVGSMVSGIANGLSKVNWGSTGASSGSTAFDNYNKGVSQDTGLSSEELAGAFG